MFQSSAAKAISDAMAEVEKGGSHPLLIDATTLLSMAKDRVEEYGALASSGGQPEGVLPANADPSDSQQPAEIAATIAGA